MIGSFEVAGQISAADIFAAFCSICGGNFIFRIDRSEWAFRNAGAAVDAGIRINVNPWPFSSRLARDHAFNRANIDAATVANA
jgi:hypothetical protein